MEFNELVEEFSKRHGIEGLVPDEDGISVDIDGIVVLAVSLGGDIMIAAEIGEPPVEGRAEFADAMLESCMESVVFFAKSPQTGKYMLLRRIGLFSLDVVGFENAIEALVNTAEVWRRMLSDFRPVAKAAADSAKEAELSFGSTGFMQV